MSTGKFLRLLFIAFQVVQKSRDAYARGVTKSIKFREQQLKAIMRMYEENTDKIMDALAKDLRRHKSESILLEIEYVKNDLTNTLMNLREWVKPEKVYIHIKLIFKVRIVCIY